MKYIELPVTIPQGSKASPSTTALDLSAYAPTGKSLYNAIMTIGNYKLPYIGPNLNTYTNINTISQNRINIVNGGASWPGTQTAYIFAMFK